jgi:hypothetical protein
MTTTPDTDDVAAQTTAQLLTDLGEFHTRTLVSPLPKHPAAMGWQALSGSMAAGFARALHALNEIDPGKAQEITDWWQGPFEEGPDPEEHTDWLERVVAKGDLAVLEKWVEDGRRLAESSKAATEEREAADRKSLTDLVKDLTNPDACHFDHHGYCQTHGWFATEPACPHGRAHALFPDTKES